MVADLTLNQVLKDALSKTSIAVGLRVPVSCVEVEYDMTQWHAVQAACMGTIDAAIADRKPRYKGD